MNIGLDQFGLALELPLAAPTSRCYRPPSWPPPRDWVCVEDEHGNPVSRWGDPFWNLSLWKGKRTLLNFGDGQKLNKNSPSIDVANADDLRLLVTWKIWGPRGIRTLGSTTENFFKPLRKIFAHCSQRGILARDLMKFPMIADEVTQTITSSKFAQFVAELDRLIDARDFLGFTLFDRDGIKRLIAAQPEHSRDQTPYIPPRIWAYQVTRLRECLDDYLAHRPQIEECFRFCADAYRHNQRGSMKLSPNRAPFQTHLEGEGKRSGLIYFGPFGFTAERFGIKTLLERWLGGDLKETSIQSFTRYLNLVQSASLAYVLNFSLMRVSEGSSIREDCLEWHEDDRWGRVPLIRGETTKTDPDSDARWTISPSVEVAIQAMRSIASLRASYSDAADQDNPYLIDWNNEPWAGGPGKVSHRRGPEIRPSIRPYGEVQRLFPLLFEPELLAITDDDLKIARAVSPTLDPERFRIGEPWPLAWHQLRRTGAVNMFASGTISDSSIQLQLKHLTRLMPLYYGRGNSSLRFNDETRVMLVTAQYEAMGRELADIQTSRFVSPHGEEHKKALLSVVSTEDPINLISEKDVQRYEQAARRQEISFRRTVLGGCMKNGQCDGDCIESVGDCAGGDGKAPCAHVLFDRERSSANNIRLEAIKSQLAATPHDTPRYRALQQERRGLENYFAYISRN